MESATTRPSTTVAHVARRCALAVVASVGLVSSRGAGQSAPPASAGGVRFSVTVPAAVEPNPVDGRVLLIIARSNEQEPRFQVGRGLTSQPIFGVDVDGLRPGQAAVVDATTHGWPLVSLRSIPPGQYWVQAVLNVYTTFHRADGHTIKAHMDQWEGQHWSRSPGNLYSTPQQVTLGPSTGVIRVTLDHRIPPIEPVADTKYIRHIKFRSEMLSKWWGHDIYLGAYILIPPGYDEHPTAHYPVAYYQDHFKPTFSPWREDPPDPSATGRAKMQQEQAYRFTQDWTSGKLPKFLIVGFQHPTPYYDDSYAVNSANNGPYGDALWGEMVPRIEKEFRAIPQPWGRVTFGGSTGGWESIAWQVFYPDSLNGTWTACPDPVDFHYFQLVNIYEDSNAFRPNASWKTTDVRGWERTPDNQSLMNQMDASHLESVYGSRGRSGDQMDIFMDVFGPMGDDGYPRLVYDKWTGKIDKSVIDYWRDHYDLNHILQRDWATLGPKLQGKLHFYVGDEDSYYLEEAAFLMKDFLDQSSNPHSDATWDIGRRQPHCYTGTPSSPGETFYHRVLPAMSQRVTATTPAGGDVSWKY
jgi:enterochelin esterase-like enzyme